MKERARDRPPERETHTCTRHARTRTHTHTEREYVCVRLTARGREKVGVRDCERERASVFMCVGRGGGTEREGEGERERANSNAPTEDRQRSMYRHTEGSLRRTLGSPWVDAHRLSSRFASSSDMRDAEHDKADVCDVTDSVPSCPHYFENFISLGNISNILRYVYGITHPMTGNSPIKQKMWLRTTNTGDKGGAPVRRGSSPETRWACAPLFRKPSSTWASFPILYGICMEEHACEAMLPHINGYVARERDMPGGTGDTVGVRERGVVVVIGP